VPILLQLRQPLHPTLVDIFCKVLRRKLVKL
jgi:hypothetical protein